MATPTIPNGEEYLFPIIYEGNGTGQRVGKFVPFTDNGTIANSVIFNDGDNAYLDRTFGSGNQKIWTFSFWVKRCTLGAGQRIISRRTGGGSTTATMGFNSSNEFNFYDPSNGGEYITSRTFEDTSKFYHFLIRYEASNGTAGDRLQIYVDGDLQTFGTTGSIADTNGNFNANVVHAIGKYQYNNSEYFDGYLAEVNWIDGTNYGPETFGVTDTSTGRWVPKTLSGITYGTNGFRLTFQNNDAVANLGYDYQTSNRSTTNDFSVTNLATTDQTTDSPTQLHNTFADFTSGASLSEGNLTVSTGTSGGYAQAVAQPSFGVNTGKWYWEVKITTVGAGLWGWKDDGSAGGSQASSSGSQGSGNFSGALSTGGAGGYSAGSWFVDHEYTKEVNYITVEANDVLMFAMDLDNGKGYVGRAVSGSGTGSTGWFNSADPAAGTGDVGGCHRANGVNKFYPCAVRLDSNSVGEYNFGQRTFAATPPDGFSAIQQDNLPETAKGVSGLVWAKSRDNTGATLPHQIVDSSRGVGNRLIPNDTNAEAFNANHLTKFLKGGYATGDINVLNTADDSMVAWNWVANSGTTESISVAGDIDIASTVQKNTTAGFSIVQWTGDNASTAGIGHGLSAAPEWILIKNLDDVTDWFVYHKSVDADKTLKLNSNAAPGNFTTGKFDHSEINATKFEVAQGSSSANSVNGSSDNMIAYCWHGVDGFSKFGSYTGNGNANGPFIYTGFTPRFLMIKRTNTTGSWFMYDTIREPLNPVFRWILADSSNAENSSNVTRYVDILSNGFKLRGTGGDVNQSGGTLVYMAFAKNPFNGDGTSFVTAR